MKISFNQRICLIFLLSTIYFASAQAQITIGANTSPNQGALLDLKENESLTNNSSKGLGMPRVKLTVANDLSDLVSGTIDQATRNSHIGLMVYATEEFGSEPLNCPGLYVWDGNKWQGINTNGQTRETINMLYDRQGNAYTIARFGSAGTWMTQNLRTTVEPCGKPITLSGATSLDKTYHYPQADGAIISNPSSWVKEYGLLYSWRAATNGKPPVSIDEGAGIGTPNDPANIEQIGVQGVCPYGWHLPSDKEWNELEKVISESPYPTYSSNNNPTTWTASWDYTTGFRGGQHGRSMKSPTVINATYPPAGLSNTDGSGFNGLLLGYIFNNLQVSSGSYAFYWSSSEYSQNSSSWARFLTYMYTNVSRSTAVRDRMFSVRCKKNE